MPDQPRRIYNILTLNQISSIGLKHFPSDRYHIGSDLPNPDVILVRSHNMLNMDIPKSVIAIGRAGAGTNNIPIHEMNLRGVPVFNTPGANANAVKELVLAGMLIAARNLIPALRYVESLQGDDQALHKQVEDNKKKFLGMELPKRTLGIIGLGKIGRLVADAALKLGMKVLGYDPKITVDSAWSLSSEVQKAPSIEMLLRHSDFVSLHIPLTDLTYHLINDEMVLHLKRDTILLNFSRDAIVDEDAIVTAIKNGKIKYYVCDFPSQRLHHQASVITLPHLGASTHEAEENCSIMVVNQIIDYLQHGNITNAVNFPDVVMDRGTPYRVAVANANVPKLLGQISTCMAKAGLNIHSMTNQSRGEMAYTLVDTDSPVPEKIIDALSSIMGVLLVRYLPALAETSN